MCFLEVNDSFWLSNNTENKFVQKAMVFIISVKLYSKNTEGLNDLWAVRESVMESVEYLH